MRYQVRYKDTMSDLPLSKITDNYDIALNEYHKIKEEIITTWVTPEPENLYIQSFA